MAEISEVESNASWDLVKADTLTSSSEIGSEDSWHLVSQNTDIQVEICFTSADGSLLYTGTVAQGITGSELYRLAASVIGRQVPLQVSLGEGIVRPDSSQLLLQYSEGERCTLSIHWKQHRESERSDALGSQAACGEELLMLVKHRQWHAAQDLLHKHACPDALLQAAACQEVLSWAAYGAGGAGPFGGKWPGTALMPGALEFMWEVLRFAPSLAQSKSSESLFLPLHDAAWGRAPFVVAVALLAVYPEALEEKSGCGETPLMLGAYVHHRQFGWPAAEVLLRCADAVRNQFNGDFMFYSAAELAMATYKYTHAGNTSMPATLGKTSIPTAPSKQRGSLMAAKLEVESNSSLDLVKPHEGNAGLPATLGKTSVPTLATSKPQFQPCSLRISRWFIRRPCLNLNRRRLMGTRSMARADDSTATESSSAIEYLREAQSKNQSRYSGANRVRHSRCTFTELWHLAIGTRTHCMRSCRTRTVHPAVQRGAAQPTWPSKAAWQRERAKDRWARRCELDFFEA
eukprot:gb/GFBE01027444.1/.p1 GENE.gb/GFBE01027444.1/~~gb/GFBE01027444.1/.p1  ORF type:complete len:517 (+),score=79.27 gb/GFBE01027444.1/:1-1551(+)